MLKIIKLSLISNKQIVRTFDFSKPISFIKMGNSKGKTSLFSLIDYLLGSSTIIISSETFKKIDYAELHTNHGIFGRKLFEKNYFTYRLRNEDGSQVVSEDYYKGQIENACLNGDTSERDSVRDLADENVTFRTYTLFNFLDEHYLGQIEKNIFSKQMFLDYYRGKYIFDYVFNKKNIDRINALKKEIDELNRKSAKSSLEKELFNKRINAIQSIFADLGIDYRSNNLQKNVEILDKFEKELLSSNSQVKQSENYYYLWDVLNNINNTIRKLKEQRLSSKNQNELNEKRMVLLNSLKDLFDGSQSDEIIAPILEIVKKCETISVAVESSDFDEAITELEKRRKEIQKEIYRIKAVNSVIDVETKRTKVAEARVLLQDVCSYREKDEINIDEEIKKRRKEMRELRNGYDTSVEDKVSNLINFYYSSLKNKGYSFIDDDYEKNNFRLSFNYKKMTVFAYATIEAENGEQYDAIAMLESMSRQTAIQICTYFAFNQLFKQEHHFPIINTLLLDNVSKPFENANKPIIYDLVTLFVSIVKDFNVIVTTDCDEDNNNTSVFYDDGLNPLFG